MWTIFKFLNHGINTIIIETHPINQSFIVGQSEQTWLRVSWLSYWCYSAHFNKTKTTLRQGIDIQRVVKVFGHGPRRRLALGRDVRLAPNTSFAHAERIVLGDQVQLGARCALCSAAPPFTGPQPACCMAPS